MQGQDWEAAPSWPPTATASRAQSLQSEKSSAWAATSSSSRAMAKEVAYSMALQKVAAVGKMPEASSCLPISPISATSSCLPLTPLREALREHLSMVPGDAPDDRAANDSAAHDRPAVERPSVRNVSFRSSCHSVISRATRHSRVSITGASKPRSKQKIRSRKRRSAKPSRAEMLAAGSSGDDIESVERRKTRLVGFNQDDLETLKDHKELKAKLATWLIYGAIILNAIQMGLEAEFRDEGLNPVWEICDHTFTAIFAIEMVIMISHQGCEYFMRLWSLIDFFLAWLMIAETWVIPATNLQRGENASFNFIRLLRLMRPIRLIKVLKIRHELAVLVAGIGDSLMSMAWISLLLLIFIYASAIFVVNITDYADYSGEDGFDKQAYFGNVHQAMLTLFSMAILAEWSQIIRPVSKVQPYVVPFFMVFVIFTCFGIMNVIIGVMVERTSARAHEKRMDDLLDERNQQLKLVTELWRIMKMVDQDNDDKIDLSEMQDLEEYGFKDIMKRINLPHGFTSGDLHMLLDRDGSGVLSSQEFIDGMFRLIYCDSFQHQCLVQLSLSSMNKAMRTAMKQLECDVQESVDNLREDLNLSIASSFGIDHVLMSTSRRSLKQPDASMSTAGAKSVSVNGVRSLVQSSILHPARAVQHDSNWSVMGRSTSSLGKLDSPGFSPRQVSFFEESIVERQTEGHSQPELSEKKSSKTSSASSTESNNANPLTAARLLANGKLKLPNPIAPLTMSAPNSCAAPTQEGTRHPSPRDAKQPPVPRETFFVRPHSLKTSTAPRSASSPSHYPCMCELNKRSIL